MTHLNQNCLQFFNTIPYKPNLDLHQEKQERSFYSFSKNNFSRSSSPSQSLKRYGRNSIEKDFGELPLMNKHEEEGLGLITGINDIEENSSESPRFEGISNDNANRNSRCEYLELLMLVVCDLHEMRKECVQVLKNMRTLVLEENSHRVQLTEYFEKLNLLHFNQIQNLQSENTHLKTNNKKLLDQIQLTTNFTLSLEESCQKNAGKTSLLHKLLVEEINEKGKSLEELIEIKKEILKESDINKKLLEENFYLREKIHQLEDHQRATSYETKGRTIKLGAYSSSSDLINFGKTEKSMNFESKLQNSSIFSEKIEMRRKRKEKAKEESIMTNNKTLIKENKQKSPTDGKEVLFFSHTQNQSSEKNIVSNLREKVREMKLEFFCLNSMAKIKN